MLNGFGDTAEIERLRKNLEATHGVRAAYNNADLSRPAGIGAMIDQTVGELGPVDILVNNAGIQ